METMYDNDDDDDDDTPAEVWVIPFNAVIKYCHCHSLATVTWTLNSCRCDSMTFPPVKIYDNDKNGIRRTSVHFVILPLYCNVLIVWYCVVIHAKLFPFSLFCTIQCKLNHTV